MFRNKVTLTDSILENHGFNMANINSRAAKKALRNENDTEPGVKDLLEIPGINATNITELLNESIFGYRVFRKFGRELKKFGETFPAKMPELFQLAMHEPNTLNNIFATEKDKSNSNSGFCDIKTGDNRLTEEIASQNASLDELITFARESPDGLVQYFKKDVKYNEGLLAIDGVSISSLIALSKKDYIVLRSFLNNKIATNEQLLAIEGVSIDSLIGLQKENSSGVKAFLEHSKDVIKLANEGMDIGALQESLKTIGTAGQDWVVHKKYIFIAAVQKTLHSDISESVPTSASEVVKLFNNSEKPAQVTARVDTNPDNNNGIILSVSVNENSDNKIESGHLTLFTRATKSAFNYTRSTYLGEEKKIILAKGDIKKAIVTGDGVRYPTTAEEVRQVNEFHQVLDTDQMRSLAFLLKQDHYYKELLGGQIIFNTQSHEQGGGGGGGGAPANRVTKKDGCPTPTCQGTMRESTGALEKNI